MLPLCAPQRNDLAEKIDSITTLPANAPDSLGAGEEHAATQIALALLRAVSFRR